MTRILICDVDDVVADLCPRWVKALLEKHPECPNPLANRHWDEWDMISKVPEQYHGSLWSMLCRELYEDVPVIPGALEGVRAAREMGYRVFFATTTTENHAGAKSKWLVRHGFLPKQLVQTDYAEIGDKTLLHGHVIIDDKPSTVINHTRAHRSAGFLFKRHFTDNHLHAPAHVMPVTGWSEVIKYLELGYGQWT